MRRNVRFLALSLTPAAATLRGEPLGESKASLAGMYEDQQDRRRAMYEDQPRAPMREDDLDKNLNESEQKNDMRHSGRDSFWGGAYQDDEHLFQSFAPNQGDDSLAKDWEAQPLQQIIYQSDDAIASSVHHGPEDPRRHDRHFYYRDVISDLNAHPQLPDTHPELAAFGNGSSFKIKNPHHQKGFKQQMKEALRGKPRSISSDGSFSSSEHLSELKGIEDFDELNVIDGAGSDYRSIRSGEDVEPSSDVDPIAMRGLLDLWGNVESGDMLHRLDKFDEMISELTRNLEDNRMFTATQPGKGFNLENAATQVEELEMQLQGLEEQRKEIHVVLFHRMVELDEQIADLDEQLANFDEDGEQYANFDEDDVQQQHDPALTLELRNGLKSQKEEIRGGLEDRDEGFLVSEDKLDKRKPQKKKTLMTKAYNKVFKKKNKKQ